MANKVRPYRVKRNRAQCMHCFDIIESKYRHGFVKCRCGEIFLDGGRDYVRSGGSLDAINYLTEYESGEEDVQKVAGDPDLEEFFRNREVA